MSVGMLILFILLISLYVVAIGSVVADPLLSKVEKLCCLLVMLIGSVFGVALVGMYSSHVINKRFKLNLDI